MSSDIQVTTAEPTFLQKYWYFILVPILVILGVANTFVPVFLILIVLLLLVIAIFIGINFPASRKWVAMFVVFLILGSGFSELQKHFSLPIPEINIDNSTNLYPMPENPNPAQQETMTWIEGKWVIHTGEGAQKVFLYSWANSIVAFFMFLLIVWILARKWMPKPIRGGSIPIQFIMVIIFIIVGVNMITSLLNVNGMSQKTIEYIDIQWFAGFLQNRWWPMLLTGIVTLTNWLKGHSARWPVTATIMSALTWLLLPLLRTVFNPTMISWTACSQMVFDSELSNALCQEAFASGAVTMLILSMAWGLIVSMITDFLGFGGDDEDD